MKEEIITLNKTKFLEELMELVARDGMILSTEARLIVDKHTTKEEEPKIGHWPESCIHCGYGTTTIKHTLNWYDCFYNK